MKKLIAFDLYEKSAIGAHHPVLKSKDGRAVYYASEVDACNALVYDVLRSAVKTALSSSGICLACGAIDEGDGEPEHDKGCWVTQARSLMESGRNA
jgi:hypothetical protein